MISNIFTLHALLDEKLVEFAKYQHVTGRFGPIIGETRAGLKFRLNRPDGWGQPQRTGPLEVKDPKTGAFMRVSRKDARLSHVDLLSSDYTKENTIENALGHRRVANTMLSHHAKNKRALEYVAVPMAEKGALHPDMPNARENLAGHYVRHAAKHGFEPVPTYKYAGGGNTSATLVPRNWQPGASRDSADLAERLRERRGIQ